MAREAHDRVMAAAGPDEEAASHVGPAFDGVRAAARDTVLHQPGPHHLAHFTGTVYDFGVDLLAASGVAAGVLARRLRSSCRQAGRQLAGTVVTVDQALRGAATGALIRIVLHTDRGAFFCDSIVPGSHVVGVVFEPWSRPTDDPRLSAQPGVRAGDEAVSRLVTGQRARLSLGSQNPGGWERRSSAASSGTPPDLHMTLEREAPERVLKVCAAAIDLADLHYVALLDRNHSIALAADCLHSDGLSKFFTQIGVAKRRAFYDVFTRSLGLLASRFARVVAGVIGARLLRLVLDVEQGAVYYYRMGPGEYLAGVTLDQARVLDADDKMSALAVACQRLLRSEYPVR